MKRIIEVQEDNRAVLGAGLLVLTACAPDALTRGGSAQPPRSNAAPTTARRQYQRRLQRQRSQRPGRAPCQPTATSASRTTLDSPLPTPTTPPIPATAG